MTILGGRDLVPPRRRRRRWPRVLGVLVVLAVLAAAGYVGYREWVADRGSSHVAARRTCYAPGAPAPLPVSQVQVRVLNSTQRAGVAHRIARQLRARHFRVVGVGNIKTSPPAVARVDYGPSQRSAALTVRAWVPGAVLHATPTDGVRLVIGHRLQHVGTPGQAQHALATARAQASPSPSPCPSPAAG